MRLFPIEKPQPQTRGNSIRKQNLLLGALLAKRAKNRSKSLNDLAYLNEEIVVGYAVPPGI
jgi:hypothetical protein